MMCGIVCPHDDCPKDCPRRAVADRLEALTGGAVRVSFSSNTFIEGDEGAKGHLYSGWLSDDMLEEFLGLDDRGPEPIEVQLVKELRRLSAYCRKVADETEARIQEPELVA